MSQRNNRYSLADRVIIHPDKWLQKLAVGITIPAIMLLFAAPLLKGPLLWLAPGLLLTACIILLWSDWCIVFDTATAAIHYSRLRLINRMEIRFEHIDSIAPVSKGVYGTCYMVTGRNGKRIRISTWYRFGRRNRARYEAGVLPLLENMIQDSFREKNRLY